MMGNNKSNSDMDKKREQELEEMEESLDAARKKRVMNNKMPAEAYQNAVPAELTQQTEPVSKSVVDEKVKIKRGRPRKEKNPDESMDEIQLTGFVPKELALRWSIASRLSGKDSKVMLREAVEAYLPKIEKNVLSDLKDLYKL